MYQLNSRADIRLLILTIEVELVRAVDYSRVSTDEQAKEGYSLKSQSESIRKFVESQGWEFIDHYVDDGYSARDLNRPDMQRLIKDAKEKEFDVVVFYKLDRLVRSVGDLDKLLQTFDANNIAIRSVTEPFDTTTAIGRFLITLVAAIAQWERETISERVSVNMLHKAKLGEWPGGEPPFGYKVENEKLVIKEVEASVVKEIFKLARTLGFYTIAQQLTIKGIPTRKSGSQWHVDSVRGIANNPVYAGYIRYTQGDKQNNKKPPREQNLFEGNHERIIDRTEFWSLQNILDKRRTFGGKRETSNYYFSSILKCARCGHSISGHRGANKVKTYRCSGKKAGKKCSSHIFLEEKMLNAVFNKLGEIKLTLNSNVQENNSEDSYLNELKLELSTVEKLMKKKKIMYENDIIDIDELISSTDELRIKEKELQKEIVRLEQIDNNKTVELKSILENIEELWKYADDYERKELMTTIFEQIVVDTTDDYRGSKYPREVIIVSYK